MATSPETISETLDIGSSFSPSSFKTYRLPRPMAPLTSSLPLGFNGRSQSGWAIYPFTQPQSSDTARAPFRPFRLPGIGVSDCRPYSSAYNPKGCSGQNSAQSRRAGGAGMMQFPAFFHNIFRFNHKEPGTAVLGDSSKILLLMVSGFSFLQTLAPYLLPADCQIKNIPVLFLRRTSPVVPSLEDQLESGFLQRFFQGRRRKITLPLLLFVPDL